MQVAAFSSPGHPDWRWRIINYAGETVEESRRTYQTIALAVDEGTKRLKEMPPDRSVPQVGYRSTSHLRGPRGQRTA
jgi:hypothetical protein